MVDLYNSQAAACSAPSLKKLQKDLEAEDAAGKALLWDSVQNEMTQSWSGAFPDLNGDPNAADTYTLDELTDAIWVLKPCLNYKDVTCNWGEIARLILEARKHSKDAKGEEKNKEEECAGSAAAVEQAEGQDAAAICNCRW